MRLLRATVAGLLALPLLACTSGSDEPSAGRAPSASPSTGEGNRTESPDASAPNGSTDSTGQSDEALPAVTSPVSLPALMRKRFTGGRVTTLRETGSTDAYRRWEISYPSGDATITGVLLRPRGKGPFPGLVFAHGHIDPSIYVTGQGLRREQDRMARDGYVVLHTDYRGHAGSSGSGEDETRLGYTRDTINAALAMKRLPYVDPDRTALLGRSMGGGVILDVLVAQPGLVDAAVLFSSVSSEFLDNLNRWTVPERPDVAQRMFDRYGSPDEAPEFYAGLSPRTYFDRVTEPVLLHHGTSDDSCPLPWARATQRALTAAGADSRLRVYDGEEHEFGPQWDLAMRRTVRFLARNLGPA
ncbi:Prolyl oligopeptidase family protein [Nocardioides terrae]|uniref:Prolyl oligopeptidase family protein n=1 Tax=Nocardioides terrae TaxID=574651 RepID=A0A1I1N5R8_9ACTN|nr:alpha/beta fold hydrolase [Nocardioides terrae]SFC89090.1 Prolyl oligopeptidase family protein [Nocardioides terrae]